MSSYFRALAQTTTYLGVTMIAVIWGGVFYLVNEGREHAYQDGLRQARNLTRVFAEYISSVVKGIDSQLLVLRALYEQNPDRFELAGWVNGTTIRNDLTIHFAIANRDAFITHSSVTAGSPALDVKDRDYFQFLSRSKTDELYIGKPVVGRRSNKARIQLARSLRAPDGSFGGVLFASLAIEGIQDFYNSVDIGSDGVISLVGFDGIIRARSARDPEVRGFIGVSLAQTKTFELYRQSSTGSYWNFETPVGTVDGVRRLISYRTVDGLPLLAIVGLAESDIFRQARAEAQRYYEIGFLLTAFTLVAIGFGAVRQFKFNAATAALQSSKQSLERTNLRFDAALENMAHGLCMFDGNQRLIVCNKRYGEMYGLKSEQTRPGTTLREILQARVAAGNSPEDAQRYIEKCLEEVARPEPGYTVNTLRNGRVHAVNHQPMPNGGWVAIHQDLTEIRRAEARAEMANQELIAQRNAIDEAMIVTITDTEGRITFVNDYFCRISGFSREELLGANHRIFKSEVHSPEFYRDMYDRITCGEVWRGEMCNRAKDGSLYWLDTTIIPRLGEDGAPLAFMAIRSDITGRKKAETQIAYLARHDTLTGLANRAVLLEKTEEALARLARGGDAFAIFMLDLDLFKVVNDSLGHLVGDELLKAVALRLSACIGERDTVARLGGDEFAILAVARGDQREVAANMARKLLKTIVAPYDLDGYSVDIGTSIGIALAPEHGIEVDQLMKSADLALYKAKSAGRNTWSLFETEMGAKAKARHALEMDLRNALTQQEFELHYQPIIDIETRNVFSVEALVRWRHPKRGQISPDEFIPLAEETGLINPLGEWVLRNACAAAMHWPAQVKVAVNLSAVQFRKGDLVDIVSAALKQSGLPPERLELEITESILMQGSTENVQTLRRLSGFGISIVLDDFGTGYSSLSYLRLFPFRKIKIDRSFVDEMSKNADCASIISAVAGLGRSLDIGTVAEGVETEEQLALIRAAGCTHAQGFLFGRPCPAAALQFPRAQEAPGREDAA